CLGQCLVSDGNPREEGRRAVSSRARAVGAGGAERISLGAAAPAFWRHAAARGTLSRARSSAEALAHGRAFRRARRAHQNGHERSAASYPPRNQGVGSVRDPFDFRSRLPVGQSHRFQQAPGACGQGNDDPALLPAQPKGSLYERIHHGRTDRKRGARRRRAGRRRGIGTMRSRFVSQFLYPLAGVVLIVAVWALACWLVNIPTVVLPSPDRVLRSLIVRGDLLLSESWITLKETLYGFLLALAVGLPLAVAVANSRPLNLMFYPLL